MHHTYTIKIETKSGESFKFKDFESEEEAKGFINGYREGIGQEKERELGITHYRIFWPGGTSAVIVSQNHLTKEAPCQNPSKT